MAVSVGVCSQWHLARTLICFAHVAKQCLGLFYILNKAEKGRGAERWGM